MIAFLLLFISSLCFAAAGPVYVHAPLENEEFKIIYNEKADAKSTPLVSSGSGAPSNSAKKVGDMYVDTSAAKVYVSTAANSTSWVALN